MTTYQAYNDYPNDGATGKSLYAFNSYGATTVTGDKNAAKVSFDRPYHGDGTGIDWGQSVFAWEISFIRWIEQAGYDVTYSTDVDTHTNGGRLLNYRGFLSVGHDEYWSKPMFDAVLAARDAGVHLAFFSANTIYWQIRFEPSSSGVPNRVQVGYKNAAIDPISDPSLKTVLWRDPPVNRPEQTLIGVQFTAGVPFNNGAFVPYVVTNSSSWVYAGTGFQDGDSLPKMVGYEADRLFSQYPPPTAVAGTYTLLSHSPIDSTEYSNSSVYQAPSGAWVFGAGTTNWSLALDNTGVFGGGLNIVDPRIQRTTANILDRFISDFTALEIGPSSMEGHLRIRPGDWISGGYSFKFTDKRHGDTTVTVSSMLRLPFTCPRGGGAGGEIVINLGTHSYIVPAGNNDWQPTGDAKSVLSWAGSAQAPNGCSGNIMDNSKGAIFDATISQNPDMGQRLLWRFKYRDPNAEGKGNVNCLDTTDPRRNRADVCGASWSEAVKNP